MLSQLRCMPHCMLAPQHCTPQHCTSERPQWMYAIQAEAAVQSQGWLIHASYTTQELRTHAATVPRHGARHSTAAHLFVSFVAQEGITSSWRGCSCISDAVSKWKVGTAHWLGCPNSLEGVEVMVIVSKMPNHPQEVLRLGDIHCARLEPVHLLQRVFDDVVHLARVHRLPAVCDKLHPDTPAQAPLL